MQQKNLWAFALVTAVILLSWMALAPRLWPPRPRTVEPWESLSVEEQRQAAARLSLVGAHGSSGLGSAADVGIQALVSDLWAREKLPAELQEKPKAAPLTMVSLPDRRLWGGLVGQAQAIAGQTPVVPGLGNAVLLATRLGVANESAGEPEHRDDIQLGGEGFNLTALFTTRGAGIDHLVLNRFKKADEYGRPAGDPPADFELIPKQPFDPSNVIYHYAKPDDPNPEATLGTREWTVKSLENRGDQEQAVVFTTDVPGLDVRITKTFTLKPGDYHLGLALKFERTGTGREPLLFRYQFTGAHDLPIEGVWYTSTYRNALIGRVNGNGDVNAEVKRDLQTAQEIGFKAGGDDVRKDGDFWIRYAGIVTQYFGSVIAVDDKQEGGVEAKDLLAWARPTVVSEPFHDKQFLDDITMRVVAEPIELRPGKSVVHKYVLYNGPVKVRLLTHLQGGQEAKAPVQRYLEELHLNTLTDYRSPSTPGWVETIHWTGLLIQCTNLMHGVLYWLHQVIPQYGICIIVLTLLVRGIMFPLSRRQALAGAKMQAKMAELAPEVKKLEEKFKNDSAGLQQAKTELYLKRGIHPLAMMGSCWVIFLQMPIFLGLYYALQESIHFRLAPFLWIKNLAAPDMLIWWGENIPYISRFEDMRSSWIYLGPFFNLLPIVAVGFMIVQQKMMTPPPTDEQAAMQQKMMKWMTLLMGFIFYKFASGLCIYFIVSSAWGLMERKLLPKKTAPGGAPGKTAGPALTAPGRAKARGKKGKDQGNGKFQKVKDFWEKVLKEAKKK
ncbi:MAG TPA: YidC/Oxa1 family insertase periplasmic-domain containing protein [Gemmataceae bacterium]|jgi:YidC/Oxa1 family membrane protein insertase|nr:YidC/Oxa1 family insertase periplasmic-domain containing protein [Gemmataceae bacterium]